MKVTTALWLVFIAILLAAVAIFAVGNAGQVPINFLAYHSTVSLALVVIGAFLCGGVIVAAVSLPGRIRLALRLRRLERRTAAAPQTGQGAAVAATPAAPGGGQGGPGAATPAAGGAQDRGAQAPSASGAMPSAGAPHDGQDPSQLAAGPAPAPAPVESPAAPARPETRTPPSLGL